MRSCAAYGRQKSATNEFALCEFPPQCPRPRPDYDGEVPIYEFVCEACGERFEELVDTGTEQTACRACGTPGAKRVLSVPAATPKLVKSGAQNRRLEDKRGTNRGGAMERF